VRWLFGLVVVGCGSTPALDPAANPLGSTANVLPYPSSLYERADAASPTGVRLDLPPEAMPASEHGALDTTKIDGRTGWPAALTIVWAAPGGVDPATLVPQTDLAASLDGSSTVIVDMTTGARVAHFAEVDVNETLDLDRQAVYLRPAQRLAGGHRFAVGIRRATGAAITDGFQAVLDDRDLGHARLDAARPRLREAIAALEAAGVPRDDLVVAWDFTVADDASATAEPLAARDAALAAMGPLGASLAYTVTADGGTVGGDPRIARRIELDFQSPEVAAPGLVGFHRDAAGAPTVAAMMTAHAFVMVPPCATAQQPAGILLYGHGFFGGLDEPRSAEYLRDLAQEGCFVVAATEWTGMTAGDVPNALLALDDLSQGFGFGERIWQGVVNFIALEQLVRGKLASELLVDAQGPSIVDPARVVFLGISQGHILGSTFVAYDPFVERGVLHVGGANWSLMFERSRNWSLYGVPLKGAYETLLDASIMEQVLEMALEPVDGATAAGVAIPSTPPKQLLLHMSAGDAQVPNLATLFQARSLGLDLVTPSTTVPFGFADHQAAATERGLVIVDEHPDPLPPETNETFGYDNQAHENPRRRAAVQQMMREFWATGMIHQTCTGSAGCDCPSGACGELRTAMYGGS